jgi:hypothetical protein
MTRRQILFSVGSFLLCAWASIGLWLYEITQIIGWVSLAWLRQPLYSVFPIIGFATFSFLLPVFWAARPGGWRAFACAASVYAASLAGFYAGKEVVVSLYSAWFVSADYYVEVYGHGLFVHFLFTAVLYACVRVFVGKIPWRYGLWIFLLFLCTLPLSLLTVYLLPGFGHQIGLVDAVKMGYPAFWTNITLGLAGLLTAKSLQQKVEFLN